VDDLLHGRHRLAAAVCGEAGGKGLAVDFLVELDFLRGRDG